MSKNKDRLPKRSKQDKPDARPDNLTPALKALMEKLDDAPWQIVTFEMEADE